MKAADLREHTDEELKVMIEDTKKALSEIKVKSIIGETSEQPQMARQHRRDIARMQTVIKEREAQSKKGDS
ncbi:50S ribosomal protein L29 [bacterium E08(2017)]|nr:50S ribosomal protein L29 [bacterium E08(2017)]